MFFSVLFMLIRNVQWQQAKTLHQAETIHSVLQNTAVVTTFFSVLLNCKEALTVLSYSMLKQLQQNFKAR